MDVNLNYESENILENFLVELKKCQDDSIGMNFLVGFILIDSIWFGSI